MKNNIAFKFIAIVLCAASLMGAIGSIAGVVALTEADLYNKTVEQVWDERVQLNAAHYADSLGLMYASTALGGCPEPMAADMDHNYAWFQNEFLIYGYSILDAEGNVVSSYQPELNGESSVSTYTYPVTGQYMHLVSVESESEALAREAQERIDTVFGGDTHFSDGNSEIPAGGIALNQVTFLAQDGTPVYEATCYDYEYNCYYYGSSPIEYSWGANLNQTGRLFCNQYGEVVYTASEREDLEDLPNTDIYGAVFINPEQNFHFQISSQDSPIGLLAKENDVVCFTSYPTQADEAAEEPAPTEETVPEEPGWVVETIPGDENMLTLIAPDGTTLDVQLPGQEEPVPAPTEETVAETSAEETDTEETAAEAPTEETAAPTAETTEETVPSSASAVPADPSVTAPTAGTEATEETEATEATEASEAVTEPIPVETMPRETVVVETIPEETVPEVTEPILVNGKTLDNYQINEDSYYDPDAGEHMTAKYVYVPMPELTVELYVDKAAMQDSVLYELLALIRQYRDYLLPTIGICLFLFAVLAVYLCTAAGRKPKSEEVRAGGLNRIPLDLYLFGGGLAIALIIAAGAYIVEDLLRSDFMVGCGFVVAATFLVCLIFVGFCFAFVAQMKTPNGFWWRNTLCGICIRLFMRFAVWLETWLATKGFPFLGRLLKKTWQFTCKTLVWMYHVFEAAVLWLGDKLGKLFRWIGGKLHRWLSLLPLTWQWLVCGMILFIMIYIAANADSTLLILICLFGSFALIFYGAHCFGILSESTKRMGKGDLDTKVDDKLLAGCFKDFAADLNDLADVAVIAAQKQLKSERMKTELITNVSHDIKTPLTSIINYVDLLQKPHTDAEEAQYLEVLDRQSQRLKKLIDDLMDMSKANTGNMQVDITKLDAVESVNQALGEFADKLDKAQLLPVFRHDDAQVPMMADGRLVWRVLSNLLSNAVKYAMPGTRLYIDLMTLEGKVVISLKNISREELNIDAEELMERFVRGDDSRNTEGSGLGLNIAKSLMELQKGQLQLLVDGDLFKVTLIFPGV